jgi:hypothetical protein
MAQNQYVFTWRGNYRRILASMGDVLTRATTANNRRIPPASPFLFDPVGAPATIANAVTTLLLWVEQASNQKSLLQVVRVPLLPIQVWGDTEKAKVVGETVDSSSEVLPHSDSPHSDLVLS